jgi:hypothetical protein
MNIQDHEKFVPYMLTEKQKQYSSQSWTTSAKTPRNPLIPYKVTTGYKG